MIGRAEQQQQGEDDDIELALPDFSRPERLVAVGEMGKGSRRINDAEGRTRRGTKRIAIQQIGTAAKGLAKNDGRGKYIHEMHCVEMVALAVPDACEHAEKDAALDGHAALPDVEELRQVMAVVIPVKEKDIPESRSQKTGHTAVNAEVDDVLLIAAAISLGKEIANSCGENNGKRKYETVGPYGEVPNVKRY